MLKGEKKNSSQALPLIQNLWWQRKCEIYSCLGVMTQKRVLLCFSKKSEKEREDPLPIPIPIPWIFNSSGNKNFSSDSDVPL